MSKTEMKIISQIKIAELEMAEREETGESISPESWCQAQLESCEKEHGVMIREIKEGLEKLGETREIQVRAGGFEPAFNTYLCLHKLALEQFWQKYGGE